jgi:hypothetical protein
MSFEDNLRVLVLSAAPLGLARSFPAAASRLARLPSTNNTSSAESSSIVYSPTTAGFGEPLDARSSLPVTAGCPDGEASRIGDRGHWGDGEGLGDASWPFAIGRITDGAFAEGASSIPDFEELELLRKYTFVEGPESLRSRSIFELSAASEALG